MTAEQYIQNGGPVEPPSLLGHDSVSLNLSASVSPGDFAERFGYLFNTWVSLGYCPQCNSEVMPGNDTGSPPTLQPFYREATATSTYLGDQVFTISWPWLTVILAFALLLLIAGTASVVIESSVAAKLIQWDAARYGADRQDMFDLQLPKTCSAYKGGLRSTWGKGVVRDMEAAAGVRHTGRTFG